MNETIIDVQNASQCGAGCSVGMIAFIVVMYVFFAFCMARMAVKTGMPFGSSFVWALIPIANIFLLLKIGGKPMWWFILLLIPIVNLVISILMWMGISERLGKPGWWGIIIGLVPVVNIIFFLILAFGEKKAIATV